MFKQKKLVEIYNRELLKDNLFDWYACKIQ